MNEFKEMLALIGTGLGILLGLYFYLFLLIITVALGLKTVEALGILP